MSDSLCLSALIVNYNTAPLTRECVASLRAQRFVAPDGSPVDLEILVVDNASRSADREALHDLDATVIYSEDNRGYGAALNAATTQAHGEFLLFSNPDTWYFPDALQHMLMAYRRLPRCGAVGPRLWWDRSREFLLPPSDAVTLSAYLQEALAEGWLYWGQYWTLRWLRRAVQYWQGNEVIPQPMLSGACLLTHREVIQKCGGFDERFRLYYEDSDWCRRLRQHGYRLYYVPTAEVAHLYNQSARQDSAAAHARFVESAEQYFHKHYGVRLWQLATTIAATLRAAGKSQVREAGYQQLGKLSDPPQLISATSSAGPYLFLLSPAASGLPAIAHFCETSSLRLPLSVWLQLGNGRFYARLVSLSSLEVLGQWSWEK